MGFLDKLFGRKKKDQEDKQTARTTSPPAGRPSTSPQPKPATGSQDNIKRVYLYVAATVPINAATADQITTYGLELLKADPTFRQIMAKVERDQVPMVKGHGLASSSGQFAPAFSKWLQTKGTSLDQATTVMGKTLFVQGGDAQNPADGSKFSWGLLGCFQ